ncbi:FAD-dependent oxidoreductase [Pseudomonas aeruginosa]|nr:FAD-dependent oxidoreductase [Pseudomonas aeruginosa]
MSQHYQHDVLVIGSGAAGLSLALTLPEHLRIAVLSKGELSQGSTYWAQGGVAAVLDDTDTVESSRRGHPGRRWRPVPRGRGALHRGA